MKKKNVLKPVIVQNKQEIVELPYDSDTFAKLDYEFFKNFTSKHTIKSYRSDIKQFFNFLSEFFGNFSGFQDISRFHVVAYRNNLSDKEYAPKTINRKLSAVSSYMDFLVEKGLMSFNTSSSIRRPRQEVITPTNDLSDDDVRALLEALNQKSSSGPLHKATIYLLFSTGIRKSELINLKLKDFKIQGGHHTISIIAKGGKRLTKVLHPTCVEVVNDYLNWMNSKGREVKEDDYLLQPTKNPLTGDKSIEGLNKSLRPSSIDYIVKTWCKKAGIHDRISPHSARASYIGSALESGEDLWKVAQDVGHSSVRTTEIYNKRRQQLKDSPAYNLGYLDKKKA
ncbi:MAG: tyrosine-type recombinase/integrase [Bacteriovoracaceae bacterium]|nr:tyrosine-type recombinase/integrase [Bacteriovoracaceae bacterium]